ncbi:MAG TPA: tRNA (adenosine(37)-N6)-threonylcarbamoyltransferase complex transferase subunit TsaD, partial [Gammaproteobacteria bacterium]|nr:tRNA (adenosine(37)-N6)-threonylcarbamoyltransferase complex transferase subunit TsaD [Gammaproteobacteria bacterium]
TDQTTQDKADIAWGFQDAVVDTLYIKCKRALQFTGLNRLIVAGGVGANRELRTKLQTLAQTHNVSVFYPRLEFCTDNGAMIAYAGYQRLQMGGDQNLEILAYPRWGMESLPTSNV